jgi:hypothetical protein
MHVKFTRLASMLTAAALIGTMAVSAQTTGNGGPSGAHWGFNIIGHPKGISGDDSNGRSIMVPLRNATGPNEITCEQDQAIFTDDIVPTFQTQAPTGARIYFKPGSTFEIIDRDATDSDGATIQVPVAGDAISFDIYIRVLGKPNTCMDIDAFALDETQGLYFWAGRVDLNRKTGKSVFVKVNELFEVNFCQVDPDSNTCVAGTEELLSVFNDVFSQYFWSILNNGTRLVQVRLYPR